MPDSKRFERDPAEGSRSTIEDELQNSGHRKPSENGGVPAETFPPFDDPAYSATPAEPPPTDTIPHIDPPKDTQYAGHPDFSQDAAENKLPPSKFGNSEQVDDVNEETHHSDGQNSATPSPDMEKLGAGPAIAEHSKDAKAPKAGRQPGAYVKK